MSQSALRRVNIASASARWTGSICPERRLVERVEGDSVATHSVIANSVRYLLAEPRLRAAGFRSLVNAATSSDVLR